MRFPISLVIADNMCTAEDKFEKVVTIKLVSLVNIFDVHVCISNDGTHFNKHKQIERFH